MQSQFSTTDTALAAYLIYMGFPVSLQNSDFPVTYHFEQTQELIEAANNWNTGSAMGNVRLFFDSYKNLLRRIKSGQTQ